MLLINEIKSIKEKKKRKVKEKEPANPLEVKTSF